MELINFQISLNLLVRDYSLGCALLLISRLGKYFPKTVENRGVHFCACLGVTSSSSSHHGTITTSSFQYLFPDEGYGLVAVATANCVLE